MNLAYMLILAFKTNIVTPLNCSFLKILEHCAVSLISIVEEKVRIYAQLFDLRNMTPTSFAHNKRGSLQIFAKK